MSPSSCSRVRSRSTSASPRRSSRPARACRTRCGCAARRPGWSPAATVCRTTWPTASTRSTWADIVFIPGYRVPRPRRPAAPSSSHALHRRPRPRRAARGHLDGRLRARRDRPARRQARHDALALHAGARAQHPLVRVDENVLFVDEGDVLTSAGAASGIDLCLHILRARPRGGRAPTTRPGAWSRRRTAAAARRSTCRAACPSRSASGSPPPASGRCTGSANR